jgi:hypothetical protein
VLDLAEMQLPEFLGPQRGHLVTREQWGKMASTTIPGHGHGGNVLILSSPAVKHAIGAADLARKTYCHAHNRSR